MSDRAKGWVGKTLSGGRYRVDAKLGEGGMGFVYKAWDRNLDTDVVVKAPRPSMLDDPEFADRFALEIRSLVKLSHPNIVKVSDVGEHDNLPFAVMQYLAGGTLDERQDYGRDGRPRPASPAALATWLPGMAAALDFIHGKGYIHRDVKPANILFDAHGHPYLSDFGVAKVVSEVESSKKGSSGMTGIGIVLGTPEYMAPELIMGGSFDGRVDQYALAATAYEILCGRKPFVGEAATAILVRQTTEDPPPMVELPASCLFAISRVILKGMAKKPGERYATCAGFAEAMMATLGKPGTSPRPPDRLACPSCGVRFAATAAAKAHRGRKIKCPACGVPFQISADGMSLRHIASEAPITPQANRTVKLDALSGLVTNRAEPAGPSRASRTVKLDAMPAIGPSRVERTMKLDAMPNPARSRGTMKLEAMPAGDLDPVELPPTFPDETRDRAPLFWAIGGVVAVAAMAIVAIAVVTSPSKPPPVAVAATSIAPARIAPEKPRPVVVKAPEPAPAVAPVVTIVPAPPLEASLPIPISVEPPPPVEPEPPAAPPVEKVEPPIGRPDHKAVAAKGTIHLREIVANPRDHLGEVVVPADLLSVNTAGGRDADLSVRGQGGAYHGFIKPGTPFRIVLEAELLGQLRNLVGEEVLVDGDYPAMMGLKIVEDHVHPGGFLGMVEWVEFLYYIDPRPIMGNARNFKEVYSVVHLSQARASTGRSKNYKHWQERIQKLTTSIRNKYEIAGKPVGVEVMAHQAANPAGHGRMFHRWILDQFK